MTNGTPITPGTRRISELIDAHVKHWEPALKSRSLADELRNDVYDLAERIIRNLREGLEKETK